jgi:hypothetical protein
MPIYLLKPNVKRLVAPEWDLSTRCEPVQVEGRDEEDARTRASAYFAIPSRVERGTDTRFPPWGMRELVSAKVIEKPDPAIVLIRFYDKPE